MKKTFRISILLFIWIFSYKLYSQTYHPFIKENAKWECVFSNPYMRTTETFYFDGVETINDTLYHKSYQYSFNKTTHQDDTSFFGFLREENQKVYRRLGTQEFLFCNFELKINDTLNHNYVVQSIDSIYVNQSYRKRWRVNYFDAPGNQYTQTSIIEGIGSTSGFIHFFDSECFPSDYTCTYLWNYYENDLIYSNSFLTDIEQEVDKYEDLTISPNPIINQSQINIASDQIYTVEFYNILGLPLDIVLTSDNLIEKRSFRTPGIYFIKITTINGQTFKRKILIE